MAEQNGQYAVETLSLTKIFPDWWGRAKVVAVDELDLKIKHNEVYGLLGPNGSGKTTTLKMLLSLLHPTKGQALALGGLTSDPKISTRIGYLPEDSYLYKYLSARETLDFYARLFGLPASIRKNRIEALLEMVGLSAMANRQVGTFSKGMARRIGLAQALINDPELLILDEPTSGMDPIGTRQMKDLFMQLAKRGKTILLCSHLLADVEDVCDRIGILYGGKMQIEGPVTSLLQQTDRKQIVTSGISEQAMQKIRQIILEESDQCEVTSPMDRLEQFFVRTVTKAQKQNLSTSGAVNIVDAGLEISEESRTSEILDKLVTAKVDKVTQEQFEDIETSTVTASKLQPAQDNKFLDKLTKSSPDVIEDVVVETTVVEVESDSQAQIDHSLLDKLSKKDMDGSTEVTRKDSSGESEDA